MRDRLLACLAVLFVAGCFGGPVLTPHSMTPPELLRVTGGLGLGVRAGAGLAAAIAAHPAEQLLAPGGERTLCDLHGAGTIRRIWLRAEAIDSGYLDNLALEAYWDGASNPAVSVTLGELAAVARADAPPFTSAVVCWNSGAVTITTPMSFATQARLRLLNVGSVPVRGLAWEVDVERGPLPPAQAAAEEAYFCARRFDADLAEPDRVILRIATAGRYLGTTLRVHGVDPRMVRFALWPDGNPRRSITSQNLPVFLGASGLGQWRPGVAPEWGVTTCGAGAIAGYRWHLSAPLHFATAMALHCEVVGALPLGATVDGVAFWYQGAAEGPAPAAYLSHPARVPVREGVLEAEFLLPPLYSSGDPCEVEITTLLGEHWSRNAELLFAADAVGDFVVLDVPVAQPGTYDLYLAYTLGSRFGTARASVAGDARPGVLLAAQPDAAPGTREVVLRGVRVAATEPRLRLRIAVENSIPGPDDDPAPLGASDREADEFRIGLDYLRLERRGD